MENWQATFLKTYIKFWRASEALKPPSNTFWRCLLPTVTNPGPWTRFPVPGPTSLPLYSLCFSLCSLPDCLLLICQPGRPHSSAASLAAIAEIHPALETRQISAGEKRRAEQERKCVCVCRSRCKKSGCVTIDKENYVISVLKLNLQLWHSNSLTASSH